jgi:hypothetical protein
MSHSAKNNLKISKSLRKNDFITAQIEKRDSSSEKPRKCHLDLKNIFYKNNPEKKIDSDLIILNYITHKSETKFSAKTSLTDAIPDKFDYNLCMINKYDENLDTSLSFISEFDLEQDENQNESFSSSDNDGECIEQFEIKSDIKIDPNKRGSIYDNKEIDLELENDWNDIQAFLLSKKPSS